MFMPPEQLSPEVSDPSLTSPAVSAWRTRHLVAIMLVALLLLAVLTLVASQANPNAVDLGATRWIQQIKDSRFAALMYWVSWFGYSPQNLVMPLVLAVPFAVRGLWVEALWVLGSQASGPVVMILKNLIHRPRPSTELVGVFTPLSDPSFPSGHVVQYATLFGVTFFLVYVLMQRSTLRTIVLILLALPIILVGPSRLYLGQHWLSDILGGYAVSVMLLIPYCWSYAKWRLTATRRRFVGGPETPDQTRADTQTSQRGQTNQAPGSARG
jgi:membrane-associated phospholipid phosphatase